LRHPYDRRVSSAAVAAVATLTALALAAPDAGNPAATGKSAGAARFEGESKPIRGKIRERVVGSSWHPGCPVGLGRLRLLELRHRGFDG
jgi:hypothetical protein